MTSIQVFVEIDGETRSAGELKSTLRRGSLSSTFIYDRDYLTHQDAYPLDPIMPLSGRTWHPRGSLPSSFLDSAPDRWGRNLIRKRCQFEATRQGIPLQTLDDRDYLLGVSDVSRQGALRFKRTPNGEFEHPSTEIPRLVELPRLLRASDRIVTDDDDFEAVKTLLDAGTGSLGGARPKASVQSNGRLMIAKFPHHSDAWDVMAWEKTALDLALSAGISVPESTLLSVGNRSVLLLDRFDRSGAERIGYVSAMTMCNSRDGEQRDYLDIVDAMTMHGTEVTKDLRELWRRIAFSIGIRNTDDHLRNHGFLRSSSAGGWQISPIFDINPNPEPGAGRATTIGGISRGAPEEAASLFNIKDYFDLTANQARTILDEVLHALSHWKTVAAKNGISEREIKRFDVAFQLGHEALALAASSPTLD
ncbi:MAG: type II toxin-antitoxin system HipA family toxin [Leucobacter sp.]